MKIIPKAFARLTHLDIHLLQTKHVTIIGLGGGMAAFLALARQGVGRFTLIDFDQVEEHNIGRQDHDFADIGLPKVEAAKRKMQRILPSVQVTTHECDFCDIPKSELEQLVIDSDLLFVAVDRHMPVAKANSLCLRTETPFVVSGMYAGGEAGEIYFHHPGLISCYRCMCTSRYFEKSGGIKCQCTSRYQTGKFDPITSDAAAYSDVQKLDGTATDIALGLLTFPDTNPHSELIKALGNRNFLQMKFRHTYQWAGRDFIAESLGIPKGNDAFVTFCCAARRDPDGGGLCKDCQTLRKLGSNGLPILDTSWTHHLKEWKHS